MEFFKKVIKSIYSPAYYQELMSKKFSYSLKYFMLLGVMLSLLLTLAGTFLFLPKVTNVAKNFGSKVIHYYPNELVITITNGQASTNVEEPYMLRMPQELKNMKDTKLNDKQISQYQNLLVIDTKTDFTLEKFNSYNTAFLLTKTSLVSTDDNGKISIQQIDPGMNFVINEEFIVMCMQKIQPWIKYIYPVGIVLMFLFAMIAFLTSQFFYLLFAAFIIWLIVKIKKIDAGYAKSYQLGMHLLTLGILVKAVLLVLGIEIPIPFIFTGLLILLAVINIKKPSEVISPIQPTV